MSLLRFLFFFICLIYTDGADVKIGCKVVSTPKDFAKIHYGYGWQGTQLDLSINNVISFNMYLNKVII